MLLTGNEEVVTFLLYLYAKTTEGVWNDAEVFQRAVFDANAIPTHGCHTDKRAYLNHIGQ